MNQDQQPQPWWRDSRLVWALVALTLTGLVITTILGYWLRWAWTGLETKSAWDWLELLIIPILLGAGALWFNQRARKGEQEQRENERKIANRQRQNELKIANRQRQNELELAVQHRREEALQRYLDRMSELILDKNLPESQRDDAVRAAAQARTLTVLRSLDGNRKGQVVRFLYESDLLGGISFFRESDLLGKEEKEELTRRRLEAFLNSRRADPDLRYSDLRNDEELKERRVETILNLLSADLKDADLSDANLLGANLLGADLSHANLSGAVLSKADLKSADLSHANLRFADLTNLSKADLTGADLKGADLTGADLTGANLRFADLGGYVMRDANEQLAQAESLVGATLPDGTVMTEEAWEEFKKRYRR